MYKNDGKKYFYDLSAIFLLQSPAKNCEITILNARKKYFLKCLFPKDILFHIHYYAAHSGIKIVSNEQQKTKIFSN